MSSDASTPALSSLQSISAVEFARRLNDLRNERDKRYAFFLGSGCSVSPGIKTAGGLVTDEWLPRLHRLRAPEERDRATWATREFGYDPENAAASYGKLMDLLFLNSEERQREIERLCDGTFPAFGYSVLAELMAQTQEKGTFNVVLTTNFDDLIADALYLFTSVRPLVIHHEALAGYIRPTRTRPLIIKLHGDNHLTPYNTPDETAALLPKTNKQVSNLLHDRGLILLGYSGNDESVAKMLEALPDEALPLSIYWVSKEEPSCRLETWLRKRKAVWVASSDFDAFMLLIHAELSLSHPAPDRFKEVFDQRMETYERLTADIKDAPTNTPEEAALKTAVEKVDQSFNEWRPLVLAANRLRKTNPQAAEALYRSAIDQFGEVVVTLHDYALFLDQQQRSTEAESFYLRALKISPKHVTTLMNYALFLSEQQKPKEAELSFLQALEVDPKQTDNLIQFAAFLDKQQRPVEAELIFLRALEAEPDRVNVLGSYAYFLRRQKRLAEAESFFLRTLEADSKNIVTFNNYALFLSEQQRPAEAESFFLRALETDPNHTNTLGNYANFLSKQQRPAEAESFYLRTIEADPKHVNALANYAQYLFTNGRLLEGLSRLDEAEILITNKTPIDLQLEVAFYKLSHRPPLGSATALATIKRLLLAGGQSKGWDLSSNVALAQQAEHPYAEWLPKLAAVITEGQTLDTLAEWPEWQQATDQPVNHI